VWRTELYGANGTSAAAPSRPGGEPVNYRAVEVGHVRILLIDAVDEMEEGDTNGHGHVGAAQLEWLEAHAPTPRLTRRRRRVTRPVTRQEQLDESRDARQTVVLVMHQLLVMPSEPHALEWLDWSQDFVDNGGAVLALLKRCARANRAASDPPRREPRRRLAQVRPCAPLAARPRARQQPHDAARHRLRQHGGRRRVPDALARGDWPPSRTRKLRQRADRARLMRRQVVVSECEIELKTHAIAAPALREKSRLRDSRTGCGRHRDCASVSGPRVFRG